MTIKERIAARLIGRERIVPTFPRSSQVLTWHLSQVADAFTPVRYKPDGSKDWSRYFREYNAQMDRFIRSAEEDHS